jgi:hypothetical protein
MHWHDLEKMKVSDLRELAKEKTQLEGVTGMTKAQLIEALAHALGIEKPHKVVMVPQKTEIKQKIRALKVQRNEAFAHRKREEAHQYREQLHRLRRKLHKMATVKD